jgi:hypothetical protein
MILLAPDLNATQIKQVQTYEQALQAYDSEKTKLVTQSLTQNGNISSDESDSGQSEDDSSMPEVFFASTNGHAVTHRKSTKPPVAPGFEGKTPSEKALYFLHYFIPFLQARLAYTFIVNTVADQVGFTDYQLARTCLEKIVVMEDSNQPAINFLLDSIGANPEVYQGYFTPPDTADYVFYLPNGLQPTPITLEGSILNFELKKVSKEMYWVSSTITLTKGEVYTAIMAASYRTSLKWKAGKGSLRLVPESAFSAWKGFLNPSTLDTYKISVSSADQPPSIELDNANLNFTRQQQDPEVIWATNGVLLDPTRLYTLKLVGLLPSDLFWKPSASTRSQIPTSAFLPDHSRDQTLKLFEKMKKIALLLSHFTLSPDEIVYIHTHPGDFGGLDFNSVQSIVQWERIYDYIFLRESLPINAGQSLIQFFAWANYHLHDSDPPSGSATNSAEALAKAAAATDSLALQISATTSWPVPQIKQILKSANFTNGQAPDFVNEIKLLQFKRIIGYATQVSVDIPRMFDWASPLGTSSRDFYRYADVAQDIQRVARSKFDLDSWATAVRPLNDILRENQKNALISYLLVQDELTIPNQITDADGLFEYFLIDVQMTSLVETSRLKQATSTVQLFVQRCMLGLEESKGVKASALDRQRWDWMQKYRVWEGNRKIFLYPENWIDPTLRDDKSELFKQLEAELLQKDLTNDAINATLKSYLYSVKQISNLQCIGLYVDFQDSSKIHVFARTRAAPYAYYYNWYLPNGDDGFWNGWQLMEVDIPHYTIPETGAVGCYVAPVVFNGSLILFIPQIMPYTMSNPSDVNSKKFSELSDTPIGSVQPLNTWQVQMGWSEYRNSKWTPRQTCSSTYIVPVFSQADVDAANTARATLQASQTQLDTIRQELAKANGTFIAVALQNAYNSEQLVVNNAAQAVKDTEPAFNQGAGAVPIDSFKILPSVVQAAGSKQSDLADSVRIYFAMNSSTTSQAAWSYNGTQVSLASPDSQQVTLFSPMATLTSYSYARASPPTLAEIHSWQAYESQTDSQISVVPAVLNNPPYAESADTYPYKPVRNLKLNQDGTINNSLNVSTINSDGPRIWLYNRGTQGADPQPFYHGLINQLLQGSSGTDPGTIFTSLSNLPVCGYAMY